MGRSLVSQEFKIGVLRYGRRVLYLIVVLGAERKLQQRQKKEQAAPRSHMIPPPRTESRYFRETGSQFRLRRSQERRAEYTVPSSKGQNVRKCKRNDEKEKAAIWTSCSSGLLRGGRMSMEVFQRFPCALFFFGTTAWPVLTRRESDVEK